MSKSRVGQPASKLKRRRRKDAGSTKYQPVIDQVKKLPKGRFLTFKPPQGTDPGVYRNRLGNVLRLTIEEKRFSLCVEASGEVAVERIE